MVSDGRSKSFIPTRKLLRAVPINVYIYIERERQIDR